MYIYTFKYLFGEMFVHVSVLIVLMFFNISFQYIKIHHIYSKAVYRNAYILTIWLSYTTSAIYKCDVFGFMLYYFG